jgi:hypothetical protein
MPNLVRQTANVFKQTIGNERSHEITNDNGFTLIKYATPKNLNVKSTMFPHTNVYKLT